MKISPALLHWTASTPCPNQSGTSGSAGKAHVLQELRHVRRSAGKSILPTGTVTFLFTDIEGSTHRWEAFHDEMARTVKRHDAILDRVLKKHGGVVFKKAGDAFCAAFDRASNAATAAVAAQRAFADEDFSEIEGLYVRMALHTGEAEERAGDYFGSTVNRVARLLSIGCGGQVLVSGICADLVGEDLGPKMQLRDLGVHRLKDLTEAEHIFQLCAPGLRTDFPPLRSSDVWPNNLPLQLTSFVGRKKDLESLKQGVRTSRLITIVGAGGVGKTRLAIQLGAEVLDQYADGGVWLLEFASITDPALLVHVLASTLNVRESRDPLTVKHVVKSLAAKHALLIFDNCEHLIGEVAKIADALLRECPNVRIIATSRQPLQIAGEWIHQLAPMAVPRDSGVISLDEAMHYSAIALFVERARAADNKFLLTPENATTVADICRRLDGIALAIELAAARVKVLNVETLEERLNERLRLLTGGSRADLPRHQTMRALIDWSYDLLDPRERLLFDRCAIFAGAFSFQAASAICADDFLKADDIFDVLISLAEKSLLVSDPDELNAHYRLLESTREYALEKLKESGNYQQLATKHAEFYRAIVQEADVNFHKIPQLEWYSRLRDHVENFRSALQWSLGERQDAALGGALAGGLERFWYETGRLGEGRLWISRALELTDEKQNPEIAARLWLARAVLLAGTSRGAESQKAAERAQTLYESVGDKRGTAYALRACAIALRDTHQLPEAENMLRRAADLFEETGDGGGLALALATLGSICSYRGDLETARTLCARGLDAARAQGAEFAFTLGSLYLADIEFQCGRFEEALTHAEDALTFAERNKNSRVAANLRNNLAAYRIALNQHDAAAADARQALSMLRESQNSYDIGIAVQHLALIAALRGDATRASRLTGYVDAYFKNSGIQREPTEKWCYDRIMASLHDQLEEHNISLLMRDGASLTEPEAVAQALAGNPLF